MVWAGRAMGKVELENAKSGLASSRKEKVPGLVKSVVLTGSEIPEGIPPATAGICGDAPAEESVAGKARKRSSPGSVAVGTEARPA